MAYEIVRGVEVSKPKQHISNKNSGNVKSWFKNLGKKLLWSLLWIILFALVPCYIKFTYIGNEASQPTDPMIKQFLLSGIDQPIPTPLPNIPESTKKELEQLRLEVDTLRKQQLVSRGNVDREVTIKPKTNLEVLALAEANHVGLIPKLAFALIQTESGWNIDAINVNKGGGRIKRTTDYGIVQLNDYGIVTGYIGVKLKLSDGREVVVNNSNWKTDMLLNMSIGFREMKSYYAMTKNVYASYSIYNGGSATYDNCLDKVSNLSTLGMTETVAYLRNSGYDKCASNVKNNFYPSYMKYNK